jgi:hypothetical protein
MAKREVADYILVSAGSAEELTVHTHNHIIDDYEPFGAPFSATFHDGSIGFYQAVVKYADRY